MDKTSQKVTKDKDPKRADAGRRDRENFMKKMKENILNNAKKVEKILPIQAMKLPALLTVQVMKLPVLLTIQAMKLLPLSTLPPLDQIILMFMASVSLLSLPLAFVYFLDITLSSLKKSSMRNKINHQNNFMPLKILDCQKNIKKPIK